MVAAEGTGTGSYQVAHAGQSCHCEGVCAGGFGEATDLRQPSRDNRSLRVVAVVQTVANARGERDDVLQRAAELYAHDVFVRIDAEEAGVDDALGCANSISVS